MNIIDFTKNGGYRLKQFTFRKMQEAYIQILKAIVAFMQVPETGNYIISGCTISGANITDGWLYIDGELCQFTQTAGNLSTKIKKNVVIQSLGFKNGVNENVFRFVNAVTDPSTGVALSAFTRVSPVFDANYVHTDNNFTNALLAHLNSLAKPDWDQLDSSQPNGILNRPQGNLLTYLKQGTYIHGDLITNFQQITISFTDIGTDQYKVIGNLVGSGSSPGGDSRINWVTREHTSTSFKLAMSDGNSGGQDVKFQYILTPDITN